MTTERALGVVADIFTIAAAISLNAIGVVLNAKFGALLFRAANRFGMTVRRPPTQRACEWIEARTWPRRAA